MDTIHSPGELRAAMLVILLLAILTAAHHATLSISKGNIDAPQVHKAVDRNRR